MARKPMTREETRAYMRRLCRIIAADQRPEVVLTPAEEARRALEVTAGRIQRGADYGYMTGARLDDYRRVLTLGEAIDHAQALDLPDLNARAAEAIEAAHAIAAPWLGGWN